jgi:hypothetical protein
MLMCPRTVAHFDTMAFCMSYAILYSCLCILIMVIIVGVKRLLKKTIKQLIVMGNMLFTNITFIILATALISATTINWAEKYGDSSSLSKSWWSRKGGHHCHMIMGGSWESPGSKCANSSPVEFKLDSDKWRRQTSSRLNLLLELGVLVGTSS